MIIVCPLNAAQEQIGKATNCLWDFVWYPANVLARCTPEQREKYLLPVIRGEKRDAYATTEADANLTNRGVHAESEFLRPVR